VPVRAKTKKVAENFPLQGLKSERVEKGAKTRIDTDVKNMN